MPLLYWYDSTHVCTTHFYREFLFGAKSRHLKHGGFIEDELGQWMREDLRKFKDSSDKMIENHVSKYKCWLLVNSVADPQPIVWHMDGGSYRTQEQKAKLVQPNPPRRAGREDLEGILDISELN